MRLPERRNDAILVLLTRYGSSCARRHRRARMKQPEMDWPIQVQSAQREVCRLLFAFFPPRLAVPGANQVLSTPINTALQCGASPGPGNTAVLTAFRLDGDCGNKPLKRFGGLGITFHRAEARCEWDNRLVQNQICARNRESWRKKCKL